MLIILNGIGRSVWMQLHLDKGSCYRHAIHMHRRCRRQSQNLRCHEWQTGRGMYSTLCVTFVQDLTREIVFCRTWWSKHCGFQCCHMANEVFQDVNDLATSPIDSSIIVSASDDTSIRIWSLDPKHKEQPCLCILAGEGHSWSLLSVVRLATSFV